MSDGRVHFLLQYQHSNTVRIKNGITWLYIHSIFSPFQLLNIIPLLQDIKCIPLLWNQYLALFEYFILHPIPIQELYLNHFYGTDFQPFYYIKSPPPRQGWGGGSNVKIDLGCRMRIVFLNKFSTTRFPKASPNLAVDTPRGKWPVTQDGRVMYDGQWDNGKFVKGKLFAGDGKLVNQYD